jgi:hypothetical protein
MSFIATAPSSTPSPAASIVTNDGFFPDVDLDQLREQMRLDGTVTYARLRAAAVDAVISVNHELEAWKASRMADGAASLGDTLPKIGGASVYLTLYLSAVYRTAKADLTERYRDFDATKSGEDKAEQLADTIGDDRRHARWAIRDILGIPRSTVELI